MRFSFLLGNLNRYETNFFAYWKNYWSWNHVDAAGFPDFRSTLHAQHSGKKNVKLIINTISSTFRVSINIRVLRAIFRVPRPSADQREIQKKDDSLLFKHSTSCNCNPSSIISLFFKQSYICRQDNVFSLS